jgi:hypothetical protein
MMARLNAFVPMKPFAGEPNADPEAYARYLDYLRQMNVQSNLADSVAYSWMDNPSLKAGMFDQHGQLLPINKSPLQSVAKGGERVMALPEVQQGSTKTVTGMSARGNWSKQGPKGNSLVKLRTFLPQEQANKTFKHELQHTVEAPMVRDIQERGHNPTFLDRKNNKLVPWSEYRGTLNAERASAGAELGDTYDRSAHEIRAHSSAMDDKGLKQSGYGQAGMAAPPEEQVVLLNSKYMQNPKLISQAQKLFGAAKKLGGKALGVAGGAIDIRDTVNLIKDVGKYGMQSNAPFQKYLGADIDDGMI